MIPKHHGLPLRLHGESLHDAGNPSLKTIDSIRNLIPSQVGQVPTFLSSQVLCAPGTPTQLAKRDRHKHPACNWFLTTFGFGVTAPQTRGEDVFLESRAMRGGILPDRSTNRNSVDGRNGVFPNPLMRPGQITPKEAQPLLMCRIQKC